MKKLFFVLLIALIAACSGPQEVVQEEDRKITDLLDRYWAFQLKEFPRMASSSGVNDYNDRLGSYTEEDFARRNDFYEAMLTEVEEQETEGLELSARIDLELLRYVLTDRINSFKYKAYLNPILVDAGFHISFSFLPGNMPFDNGQDYENYIKRLRLFPRYAEQHIELMRKGIELGIMQPAVILDGYDVTYRNHIVAEPEESVFYAPFEKIPATISESDRNALIAEGQRAIMEGIVAGYEAISIFFEEEYYPAAPEKIGALNLPEGPAYYQARAAHFTTTGQTVQEIHDTGLAEVKRIRAQMEQIIRDLKFKGSFNDFLSFLRKDKRFYAKTPEELIKQASYIAKRADAKMPSMFKLLPRQPYGVVPVPDHLAPKYTGGRAVGSPINGTEPGYYWVNTYNLPSRPLYTLEALTLHEAVPGHHLQGALAQELEGIHPFRQNFYISAYGEGWGLYCEYLGQEMGFYQDPYSQFGRLTYEMWRACRLVVDTGIHAFGWTRDQVMNYMAENTALSLHEIRTETDRYISWPGQALAYKIGELKIRELREKAERSLGDKFDIRDFHDRVLSQGTVTLPILELIIDDYIQEVLSVQ